MNLLSNDINIQLSIIIPTFNTEKYIHETLESLSNINKINTEIIIIDDCSHDKTLEIAKSWLEKNKIISQVLVNDINRGPSHSRNKGLHYANGKYITFFDSDDICISSCYDKVIQAMEINNIDLCILGAKSFNDRTQTVYEFPDHAIWQAILNESDYKITTLSREPRISGLAPNMMNKIFKNEFIKHNEIVFPEGLIFEDLYFYASSMMSVNKILLVNEDILLYRVNREGQLTSLADGKYNDIIEISAKVLELNKSAALCDKAWSNLIGTVIKLNVWCSENCHFDYKKSFLEKSIKLFENLPDKIFDTYKKSNPLSQWEENIITSYQEKNTQVLEVVAEGGYPDLPIKDDVKPERGTTTLYELREMLDSLISQQRDGWANDRFNVLNGKIDTINDALTHYEQLFKNNISTNHFTLEKIEEILLILHHEVEEKGTEGHSIIYDKIAKSINDIKNKLK